MKTCSKCGVEKDDAMFSRTSRARGYKIASTCRACNGLRASTWVKTHPDKRAVICARYYEKNPERFTAIRPRQNEMRRIRHTADPDKYLLKARKWREENRVRAAQALAAWKLANRAHCTAQQQLRQASQLRATPAWANEFFIAEAYDLAQRRTKSTGIEWQVDHKVPLRSKRVCGLHTEHNLQIIPAAFNRRKGNRWWPDMPAPVVQQSI